MKLLLVCRSVLAALAVGGVMFPGRKTAVSCAHDFDRASPFAAASLSNEVRIVDRYQVIVRPEIANGGFGWAIDSDGGWFAVTAPFSTPGPKSAFIYDDCDLEQPAIISSAGTGVSQVGLFGDDIAISTDYALIGSLQEQKSYLSIFIPASI